MKKFDLLTTVETGGCSAKISASQLKNILSDLPKNSDKRLLVGVDTHDDAGVFKLTDEIGLIQTTDFFPPICSDAYDFGQIAASNSLSDVYAMGGDAISVLNLVMFPSTKIPMEVLKDILKGGFDKVKEANAVIAGGHTIDDYPPKYGLAVSGTVHPNKIIKNCGLRKGDVLILTKPIGTGIIIGGRRMNIVSNADYNLAIDTMKQLNKDGSKIMQKYNVIGATDITGFGLLGHALKMAIASNVTVKISANKIPVISGAYNLAEQGCLPCGIFKNQTFIEENSCEIRKNIDFNLFMLACDPQTSGGLLMGISTENADSAIKDLKKAGYKSTSIIGEVLESENNALIFN